MQDKDLLLKISQLLHGIRDELKTSNNYTGISQLLLAVILGVLFAITYMIKNP